MHVFISDVEGRKYCDMIWSFCYIGNEKPKYLDTQRHYLWFVIFRFYIIIMSGLIPFHDVI